MLIKELLSLWPYWSGVLIMAYVFHRRQKEFSKEILWAALRVTLQLILLAYALEYIFRSRFFILTFFVSLLMTLNSSGQVLRRSKTGRLKLFWPMFFINLMAIWPLSFLMSLDQGGVRWFEPEVLLPLLGMLLGNSLSGISIGVESFKSQMEDKRNLVLTHLALGAEPEEATRNLFFASLKAGITPHLNSMISMGMVSIPGMMSGQLISGTSALNAAILQIKLMLILCLATITCITMALFFIRRKFFTPEGVLCLK